MCTFVVCFLFYFIFLGRRLLVEKMLKCKTHLKKQIIEVHTYTINKHNCKFFFICTSWTFQAYVKMAKKKKKKKKKLLGPKKWLYTFFSFTRMIYDIHLGIQMPSLIFFHSQQCYNFHTTDSSVFCAGYSCQHLPYSGTCCILRLEITSLRTTYKHTFMIMKRIKWGSQGAEHDINYIWKMLLNIATQC